MSAGSRASLKRPNSIDEVTEEVGTDFEEVAVPEDSLQDDLSFASVFAGRHTAAPELVIGPQFVLGGATFSDMVVGSLIGNAMAVLAWRFVCAPLAVQKRFSTYYAVKRICGDKFLALYNVFIALVLGGIAGFMFSLAANALAVGFRLPPQTGFIVTDPGHLAITAVTGAFTTVVAMYGFKVVAFVSYWLTPPMFIIIGYLIYAAFDDLGIGFSNFNEQMSTVVYTGVVSPGKVPMTFLTIILTAFVQDQFVHIGCVDLTLFRFARTASAGWQSAWGMYLGHFFLWIGAGVLFRSQVVYNQSQCAPNCEGVDVEELLPGSMAFRLGWWPGLLSILFASWSTANPFLYAGGLGLKSGFQALGVNASTRVVTAIMGVIATVVSIFPGLVEFFLLFVQVGGTLLVPVGAIIVADTWILPMMGGQPEYSYNESPSNDCKTTNPAAALAWWVGTGLTCPLSWTGVLPGFYAPFINFPLTVILYIFESQRLRPKAGLMQPKTV